MAKIKQAATTEIHWNIPNWNQGTDATARLRQLLKEDARYFAKAYTGNNVYYWENESPDWKPLSHADNADRTEADRELSGLYRRISQAAPKYVDQLMTVPNDDYIFYRRNQEGKTEILLTGWGYSNYKKAVGGSHRVVRDKTPRCDCRIGFTVDGELQPGRYFIAHTAGGTSNMLSTGEDGWFMLKGLRQGESQKITDEISGKSFNLVWGEDHPEYILDVTPEIVTVDEPEEEEEIKEVVPPEPPEERNEDTEDEIIPPEIPRHQVILRVIDAKGRPLSGANISMIQPAALLPPGFGQMPHHNIVQGTLESDGSITFPADSFKTGLPIETSLVSSKRSFQPIKWEMEKDEYEYLLHELPDKGTSIFTEMLAATGYILAAGLTAWGSVELGKYLYNLIYF